MISPLTVAGAAAAYFHIYGTAFPFNPSAWSLGTDEKKLEFWA
ncbi:hypothetical protein PSE_3498 [Pseudovibrio sp. FO-BEG1]|nr:hypothetical protein PSE_3498 [Pseudovibrio sp. FO-BEG1]